MLCDGVYGLTCHFNTAAGAQHASAIAVLRGGRILGADEGGGIFSGVYHTRLDSMPGRLAVRLDVPPYGELITGFSAGPDGAALEVEVSLDGAEPAKRTLLTVAGAPLEIELAYLGAVPG